MTQGLFSSIRSLLALLLALATGFGGLVVVGTGDAGNGGGIRGSRSGRESAALIAERIEEALLSVGRDLSLVGESLAAQTPEAAGDAAGRLFAAWRRLRPDDANILFADRGGRILAASAQRIVGGDVSGSPWFARSLQGVVIGESAEGSRAGAAVARNLIVAAPAGGGTSAAGIVAVQLDQSWVDAVVATARRALADGAQGLSIQVLNGSGRVLHRSGPEMHGSEASVTVGDVRQGGVGWLVSVRAPEPPMPGSPVLLLLAAVLLMAGLGWLVGGCLTRNLAYASALCRHDTGRSRPGWILTRDLHDLTTRLRAFVELSLSRERLLQEKRIALARSRDRIRAIRNLSGSSCWEIDLITGQVIWTDGDEAASERACTLSDVLAHLEPDDRPAFGQALAMVRADRHAVRDVVVRTRAGGERISGRRLALRFAAGRADSTRLYALSRAYMEPAREEQTAPPPSSAAAPSRLESGGPDLDSALTAAIAALGTFMDDASEGSGRSGRIPATALRGAVPSHRVRASSRPGPAPTRTEAAAFTLAAALEGVVTLIRESARPEMARVPPREADLPPVRRMRG